MKGLTLKEGYEKEGKGEEGTVKGSQVWRKGKCEGRNVKGTES